jgi:hypothetical protein
VDVKTAETGELWDQSLQLTEITRKLKRNAGNATHFVVFDACRNTLRLTRPGSKAVVQSKGFVPVAQEAGMLIAYATAEGELASDVGAGAGPYAKALADEIVKPGAEAVVMFRRVQVRVRSAINQEPWLGFSASGEVYLAGSEPAVSKPTERPIVPVGRKIGIRKPASLMTLNSISLLLAQQLGGEANVSLFALGDYCGCPTKGAADRGQSLPPATAAGTAPTQTAATS